MSDNVAVNTDRELWREVPDDYYAPSIHVTASGSIGIDVGGTVYVKPLREWHKLAAPAGEGLESSPSREARLIEALNKMYMAAKVYYTNGQEGKTYIPDEELPPVFQKTRALLAEVGP